MSWTKSKLELTISLEDGIKLMREGKEICQSRTGWWYMSGDQVFFACGGEYPCCHDDMPVDEFRKWYKDERFTLFI
jgi:hypothetical protein